MNSKYYLKILQLEGYRPLRFMRWILSHHFTGRVQAAEEPVWTAKAVLLYRLAWGVSLVALLCAWSTSLLLAVVLALVLYFNSYLALLAAWSLLRPYELVNRVRVKYLIRRKILSLTSLRVIGITGSYGKTSTKMILHRLLPNSLMTPKSYNTLFGIWNVVDYELAKHFSYFICEMGAYKRGDVREFCELTLPQFGMLTGINEQHLERFGSIENTIKAKFEITQYLRPGGCAIVNLDNERIRKHLDLCPVPVIGYSLDGHTHPQCEYVATISEWQIVDYQTSFTLEVQQQRVQGTTALIGRAHLSNILGAATLALHLGEPMEEVLARITALEQIPNRLECRRTEGYTLLDNSYSSNPSGFRDSIDALSRFEGHKTLITPGLVELGEQTTQVHEALGRLSAEVCDEVVLVGDSDKTRALRQGMSEKGFASSKIRLVQNRAEMLDVLRSKAHSGEIVLLENDLPDQYL